MEKRTVSLLLALLFLSCTTLVAPASDRTVVFTAPRNQTIVCTDDIDNLCTASTQCSKNGSSRNMYLLVILPVIVY
jgi:hypothetical protein